MEAHKTWEGIKSQVEKAQMQNSPVPGLGKKNFLARSLRTHQPETMLLWLTLTILWSTTCWANEMFGNGGGTYFSTSAYHENYITGIRVSISLTGILKSIQLRYGSSWSDIHGVSGGHSQEFILQPNEYITGAYGSYKVYLHYLVIHTNTGREATFGKESGNRFVAYPDKPGMVLTGLFGHRQLLGITSIGFKWDYPPEESTAKTPETS